MRSENFTITVDGQQLCATLAAPATALPGVLFVHGWGGSQEQDLAVSRKIASLGCVCMTMDLRGHAATERQRQTVTPADNLADVAAAYDALARHPSVDAAAIAVIGSSYGGYLACILGSLRPVRWLALRAPAIYEDRRWKSPKAGFDRKELMALRRNLIPAKGNNALEACLAFTGDALIVRSEYDSVVPEPVIASYMAALRKAHSLTYRVLDGADHGLSDPTHRKAYNDALIGWITEMVLASR